MIDVVEDMVNFRVSDGTELEVYQVRPRGGGPFPSVIVVHEIWGLNTNIMSIARQLAREGFAVFAPNLYSRPDLRENLTVERIELMMDIVRKLPPEKRRDSSAVMDALARELPRNEVEGMRGVVDALITNRAQFEEQAVNDLVDLYNSVKSLQWVYDDKVAIWGFCMGGYIAFQSSTKVPFTSTVIFYGANPRPVDAVATIKGPVLGIYAGNDPAINSGLPALVEAVVKYGKDFEMKIYPGTVHGFFNDQRPTYDPRASQDAWVKVVNFLWRTLKGGRT